MEANDNTVVDPALDVKIKPCLSCMAPNLESAEFCVDCGQPFGGATVLSPMATVRAEAAMWSGVLPGQKEETRPTKLKLIVIWVILLPLLLMSVGVAIQQIYIREGLLSFVVFWVGVAISWFSVSGLYRVTKDYFKLADPSPQESGEDRP